ncbi:MAG: endonuclease [Clostridia bacterium]|nr:endonuclease [Clostridia bacterium]
MSRILSLEQENILVGSILGDGSLAKYGRSKNAYYREHGCLKQNGYRHWKAEKLEISYHEKHNKITSKSLPIFTKYHELFYRNNTKVITPTNIQLLSHPIGLLCLYLDDGSLVIDTYKKKNGIHAFPRIYLYTQSFTREENLLLLEHIKTVFNITFKLKKVPNGSGWCLEISKRNELINFIESIKPYATEIKCMLYKIDVLSRLNAYKMLHPDVILDSTFVKDSKYSIQETQCLIEHYHMHMPQKEIASLLGRSYYSVVDKIRRLKIENKI